MDDHVDPHSVPAPATRVPWHRQTKAFALRNLRYMLRSKATAIWGFGFPAFWYLLTSLFFLPDAETLGGSGALADIKGATAVSLGLFAVLTVTLVVFAGGLTQDLKRKRYRKLRSLPVAPSADFAGRFLAGLAIAAVAYAIVIVVGLLDGASYAVQGMWSLPVAVGAFLLFSAVGVSVAVAVTWLVDDSEFVVAITNALLLVSFFLTAYNGLTPELLPESSQWLVNVAPNSLAARLQMGHLTGVEGVGGEGGVTPPGLPTGPEHVVLLSLWALVLGVVAVLLIDRAVYSGEGGE